MTEEFSGKIIDLLKALPNGFQRFDQKLSSLVETSTNLASVKQRDGSLEILFSTRSSVESQLEYLRNRIEIISERFGMEVSQGEAYPAWQPDYDSPLLARARRVFQETYDEEPEVKSIHAGLETGIIGEKSDGLDMIAMGPSIESPHSPEEKVNISSVGKFWRFLLELVKSLG